MNKILRYFGTFKERLVKIYALQILRGLEALHSNDIVHGDLKLSNTFVDDIGVIKLADFGFMKQTFVLESEGEDIESFRYITCPLLNSESQVPPELCKSTSYNIEPSYDIWCFGLVIYEMLTGSSLFNLFEKHLEGLYLYLKGLDEVPPLKIKISDD